MVSWIASLLFTSEGDGTNIEMQSTSVLSPKEQNQVPKAVQGNVEGCFIFPTLLTSLLTPLCPPATLQNE